MKKIPAWIWMMVAALLGAGLTFLLVGRSARTAPEITVPEAVKQASTNAPCGYITARVRGFHWVQPMLYAEPMCESPRFLGMRNAIDTLVRRMRTEGRLGGASVYVRDFNKAEWTWYNGDERYDPGSMLKLPILLTWLAMIDAEPSLLQRSWVCSPKEAAVDQNTAFPSAQADAGRSYTVHQLLELMIVHSDNRATSILTHHMAPERFFRTFQDLGLPVPDRSTTDYRMNVRDYSVFMKALYNSSYLSPTRSEYALELMTRAEFKNGLVAGLPAGTDVAHKFGEAGNPAEKQLHETGLVYMEGYPYLITVMTRGDQVDSLAEAIASISQLVFTHMRPA